MRTASLDIGWDGVSKSPGLTPTIKEWDSGSALLLPPGPPSGSIYRLWRTTEDLFLWYILHSCYSFLPAIPLLRLAWLLSNPLFPSRVPRYSLSCSLVEGGSAQRTPRRKFHNCNNILSTFEKLDPSFPFNDPVRDKLNKNMHNSCQKFVRLCDFNEDTEPLM